jgi:hypothetical protein
MYRYELSEQERERSNRQAQAQEEFSAVIDRRNKTVGNLGEVAVWRWCQTYLPDESWEWHNREAWENGTSETNPTDFNINGVGVDVKTTSFHGGRSAGSYVKPPEPEIENEAGVSFYVFARVTDSNNTVVILGWARYADLTDRAQLSSGPFEYFPVHDMHSIIPQLGITQRD